MRRLPWVMTVIALACGVADTFVVAASQPLWSEDTIAVHGWPLVPGACAGSAVMGAVLLSRYPRHPVGWLLNLIGFTSMLSLLGESYGIWVLDEGGPGPVWLGELAGWSAVILGGPLALAGLSMVFLLVPDGRLPSPRWRIVVAAAAGGMLLYVGAMLTTSPRDVARRDEPGQVTTAQAAALSVAILLVGIAVLASIAALIRRYRRAQGEVRQQLRWVVSGASAVGFGLLVLLVGQAITAGGQTKETAMPLFIAYFTLPFCIAVAVLRYRLYDIDVIINRAVVLAAGTLFVGIGYTALVVGVGGALGNQGYWTSVLATALVALAFQPLRRRVLRFADRLVYGARAAPYDALSAFSRRVGRSVAPEALLPTVAEAAGSAVSAQGATAELHLDDGSTRQASWGRPVDAGPAQAGVDVEVPVRDRSGDLGRVTVVLPRGSRLRPADLRLLQDIAEQAAVAFRNARLEAELAAHVDALDARTRELAESRRRLVEAGDAERRRLEGAISREVLPALLPIPGALQRASESAADRRTAEVIGHLVTDATGALESLRTLTRGIYPTALSRGGLAVAIPAYVRQTGLTARVHVHESAVGHRLSPGSEAAAYFCCTEALQGVRGEVTVRLAVQAGHLELEVEVAGAVPDEQMDAVQMDAVQMDAEQMLDRVEASGGSLQVSAEPGRKVRRRVLVRLPLEAAGAPSPATGLTTAESPLSTPPSAARG